MKDIRKITPDNFDNKARKVYDFVSYWHRLQRRKYSKEPYVNHLAAVANTVWTFTRSSELVAVALCHDLYEDTECPEDALLDVLKEAGYDSSQVEFINHRIWELTDQFTREKYPNLNRRERMQQEITRLGSISAEAQTVKYADILDNQPDIAKNDPAFSVVFTREAKAKLQVMNIGLPSLYGLVKDVVEGKPPIQINQ